MRYLLPVSAALAVALSGAAPAQADDVADHFRGKDLPVLIGYGAGGGYDTTTRIFARYFSEHVPGNQRAADLIGKKMSRTAAAARLDGMGGGFR